ncbi:MAG: MtaA/CmuA family methyltransferase [Synergistaceae bacterium]|jgi:[methyl-Co(III) methanol-specific corrinoid protein]:coenzyme M methyltransferase|nr:MtaA/CmuA family methyltransferase [Synergistaceae bacterium]
MLTPTERLKKTVGGKKADRPPCICPGGMMNMITADLMDLAGVYMPDAHADAGMMANLAKAVYEKDCFENVGVPFCMTVEAEGMGAQVNLGTKIYEPHVVAYAIDTVADFPKLNHLNVNQGRAKTTLDAIRLLKQETAGIPVIGNLTGPISTAASLMEPMIFYKELRKKNAAAHAYMEFVTDQLIAFGQAQIAAGVDVIAISDPSGTGEILGPKHFKEFAVKYLNKLLAAIERDQVNTIVHICGQMRSVYKEINEVKSDVLSFDSIVPLKEARQALGDRILMGNVSTYALEFADEEKVKAITQSCLKNGADIISPACGLGMKSPLANVRAILKCVKET